MVDTNCNPKNIDYVIPANDDAIRGIQLIVSVIAQAVSDGKNLRKDHEADLQAAEAEAQLPQELRDEMSDEDLLGASTLAKIKQDEKENVQEVEIEADVEADVEVEAGADAEVKAKTEAIAGETVLIEAAVK